MPSRYSSRGISTHNGNAIFGRDLDGDCCKTPYKERVDGRDPYGSHADKTSQRKHPQKWGGCLNATSRVLSDAASYGSASGSAIFIEAYNSHSFHTPETPGIRGRNSGVWTCSVGYLQRLLRHFRLKSVIEEGGKTSKIETESIISLQTVIVGNSGIMDGMKLTLAQSRISTWLEKLQISEILSDPPPRLFLAACIVFSLAIGSLWASQRKNKYKGWIFGFGMMLGILAALKAENMIQDGKGYLAWSAIFALALSSLVHIVLHICHRLVMGGGSESKLAEYYVDKIEGKKLVAYDVTEEKTRLATAPEKEGATEKEIGG